MKETYKRLLTSNRPQLVDEIDSESGLINFLESKKILTKRQTVTISRYKDPYKKNEAILDALHKRPDEDFFKFCDALKATDQAHVVEQFLSPIASPPVLLSSTVSRTTIPPNSSAELKVLGIDWRKGDSAVKLVGHAHRSGKAKVDVPRVSQVTETEINKIVPSGDIMDSPQLINLEDIVIKNCERNFYNSNRHNSYQMSQRYRGKCLIFSVYETVGQDPRQGAEVDERILEKLFKELHFKVDLSQNPTAEDIQVKLNNILNDPNLCNDECFILFMMSHGTIQFHDGIQSEVVFGSDGKPIPTSQILEPIANCQALSGKPKVAFFQACRGDYYDQSDSVSEKNFEEEDDITKADAHPPGSVSLPDFIIGFPTQSGFRSFRNTKNGSWYINAIVRVFMEDSHHLDVSAMLRKVNGMVSRWLPRTNDPRMLQKGQIACISDNLRKPYLYLFPGIIEEEENR